MQLTDTPKKILEKEFFVLEINKTNKNFRKYPEDVVMSWIDNMDDYGYEIEYSVFMKPSEIQYEFIKTEMVCGLVTELYVRDNKLFARVKFSVDGFKSEEIYESVNRKKTKAATNSNLNIDECVIVPKGKSEVRDGVVQRNYTLYGFNLVHKTQSSFYFEDEKK